MLNLTDVLFKKTIKTDRDGNQIQVENLAVGRIAAIVLTIFVVIPLIFSMFNNAKMGYTYVLQNSVTGTSKVYHGPDFIFKAPFVATITEYKDDTTLSFAQDREDFTSKNDPISIGFADTYKAHLPLNARMVLPSDDEHDLIDSPPNSSQNRSLTRSRLRQHNNNNINHSKHNSYNHNIPTTNNKIHQHFRL